MHIVTFLHNQTLTQFPSATWKYKQNLKMPPKNISFADVLHSSANLKSTEVKEKRRQRKKLLKSDHTRVLAVGSALTSDPSQVAGAVLVCRGGTGLYIAPQTVKKPRRQQPGSGWQWGERKTSQAPRAHLQGDRLTLICCGLIHASHPRARRLNIRQAPLGRHAEWRMHLSRGHLRDRSCQQSESFDGLQRSWSLTKDCRAALPDHVWMLFALDGSTMTHALELKRMASLRNGCSPGLTPRWAPAN